MSESKPPEKPKTNWNDFLKGDEKELGLSKDVVRKLRQMNPNLQDGSSTEDFLKNVKKTVRTDPQKQPAQAQAQAQGQPGKPPSMVGPAQPKPQAQNQKPGDLLDALLALKNEVDQKNQSLDAEIKKLQEQQKGLREQACEKFIGECLALDPGLTSPKSQYVLTQEKAFLDAIGFSVPKLVERQRQRK